MMEAINKTKQQIERRNTEIAKLQAEVEILNSRLKEQERLLREFNKKKAELEKAAQDLIDSAFFDYEEVVEQTTLTLTPKSLKGEETKPIEAKVLRDTPVEATLTDTIKNTTEKINNLSESLDNKSISPREAEELLGRELDDFLEQMLSVHGTSATKTS